MPDDWHDRNAGRSGGKSTIASLLRRRELSCGFLSPVVGCGVQAGESTVIISQVKPVSSIKKMAFDAGAVKI